MSELADVAFRVAEFTAKVALVYYAARHLAPQLRPQQHVMFSGVSMYGNGGPGPFVKVGATNHD